MNTTIDLVTILGNISQSLYPVQKLITGLAYVLGILLFVNALGKLKKIAETRAHSSSHEKMSSVLLYAGFGAALIYLPTALHSLANTAFGVGNVLTYSNYNPRNIYSVIGVFIRTAGLLWFVRGSMLVVYSSEPGSKEGPKGLVFILSGILAMNFDNTIAMANTILSYLISWTMKSAHGL